MTDSCSIVYDSTEERAIEKFLRKAIINNTSTEKDIKEGIDYYRHAVTVYDMEPKKNHPKIKEVLTYYVSTSVVDAIMDASEAHALHEFDFHLYRNFS
jgi:hypothetical protein